MNGTTKIIAEIFGAFFRPFVWLLRITVVLLLFLLIVLFLICDHLLILNKDKWQMILPNTPTVQQPEKSQKAHKVQKTKPLTAKLKTKIRQLKEADSYARGDLKAANTANEGRPLLSIREMKITRFGRKIKVVPYTVKLGESFVEISKRFQVSYHLLQMANNQIDPRDLHAGQTIYIPIIDKRTQTMLAMQLGQERKKQQSRTIGYDDLERKADLER